MRLNDRDIEEFEVEDLETVRSRVAKKKKKKKKGFLGRHPSLIPVIIVSILILIVAAAGLGGAGIESFRPINADADIPKLFGGLKDNEAGIIYNDIYEKNMKVLIEDGKTYIPFVFVKKELNDWFYRNEKEGVVLYTTPEGTDRYEDGAEVRDIGGTFCISTETVLKYTDIIIEEHLKGDSPYIHIINEFGKKNRAEIKKKTGLHTGEDKKSSVISVLEPGTEVDVLKSGSEWSKIQDKEGFVGYVAEKDLDGHSETVTEKPGLVQEMVFPAASFNEKILLGWHQVLNRDANSYINDILDKERMINVISPTWYFLSDTEGGLTDNSSAEYVEAAHAAGKKVWPVIDNFNNTDFLSRSGTAEVLSSTEKRKRVVDAVVSSLKECGADGLNVDFETLKEETGEDYAQFLKELSNACHDRGLVLSIDNYVPGADSIHYNREVQGKVADFCVIMGYDEYYAGSSDAGPVASIDYVERGIQDTLIDVDPSKVINGLPFYSRLWETQNGNVISTQALDMATAAEAFNNRGVSVTWDDSVGCNYGEYEENGSLWRMWLEDRESLGVKLNVMKNYDLAGAAFWKLGMEDSSVWDEVSGYAGISTAPAEDSEG